MDKILRGEVEILAVEDARKTKEDQGELQNIVAHLPGEFTKSLNRSSYSEN